MTEVRFANSKAEIHQALKLAQRVFTIQDTDSKISMWLDYPGFEPQHTVLMIHENTLAGVMRAIPTELYIGGKYRRSAALSSICVAPEWKGKGLSNFLMEETLRLLKDQGYELAHLLARKSVDHYYNKFGFLGVSSYEKVHLRVCPEKAIPPAILEKQPSDFYDLCFEHAYKDCEGKSRRSQEYWSYALGRAESMSAKLIHLTKGQNFLGYLAYRNNQVLELGYLPGSSYEDIQPFLPANEDSRLTLELPHDHHFIKMLPQTLDITFENRQCLYGGHMACDLSHRIKDLFELKVHFEKNFGISLGARRQGKGFNLPFFDQL